MKRDHATLVPPAGMLLRLAPLLSLLLTLGFVAGYFTGRTLRPGITDPGALPMIPRVPPLPENRVVGQVLAVIGQSDRVDADGTRVSLSVGDALPDGCVVQSLVDGRSALWIRRGVMVHLDQQSSVRVNRDQPLLTSGRVYLAVRTETKTTVQTDSGLGVTASDAEFVVAKDGDAEWVHLLFGTADVSDGTKSVRLHGGQGCRSSDGILDGPHETRDLGEVTAWQSELLLALRR